MQEFVLGKFSMMDDALVILKKKKFFASASLYSKAYHLQMCAVDSTM